jgi:hypothetical protein
VSALRLTSDPFDPSVDRSWAASLRCAASARFWRASAGRGRVRGRDPRHPQSYSESAPRSPCGFRGAITRTRQIQPMAVSLNLTRPHGERSFGFSRNFRAVRSYRVGSHATRGFSRIWSNRCPGLPTYLIPGMRTSLSFSSRLKPGDLLGLTRRGHSGALPPTLWGVLQRQCCGIAMDYVVANYKATWASGTTSGFPVVQPGRHWHLRESAGGLRQ